MTTPKRLRAAVMDPNRREPGSFIHFATETTTASDSWKKRRSQPGGEPVGERALPYLNRLSDLLFVLGRSLNRAARRGDVLWRHERKRKA